MCVILLLIHGYNIFMLWSCLADVYGFNGFLMVVNIVSVFKILMVVRCLMVLIILLNLMVLMVVLLFFMIWWLWSIAGFSFVGGFWRICYSFWGSVDADSCSGFQFCTYYNGFHGFDGFAGLSRYVVFFDDFGNLAGCAGSMVLTVPERSYDFSLLTTLMCFWVWIWIFVPVVLILRGLECFAGEMIHSHVRFGVFAVVIFCWCSSFWCDWWFDCVPWIWRVWYCLMKLFGSRVGGYCFDWLSGFHLFGAFDAFRGFDGFAFVHHFHPVQCFRWNILTSLFVFLWNYAQTVSCSKYYQDLQ